MAAEDRRPPTDLTDRIDVPLQAVDFLPLLRAIEAGEARFGVGSSPALEPARFHQVARQAFATRDVAQVDNVGEDGVFHVHHQAFCLLGPDGPMPSHITRWAMDRLSQRWFVDDDDGVSTDTTFVDFCDMLQHRMTTLFYRAWAQAHPEVENDRGRAGLVETMMCAMIGIGLPGQRGADRIDDSVRLGHVSALAGQVLSPERCEQFIRSVVRAPVELIEFVGAMTPIPRRIQSCLGDPDGYSVLGKSLVLGARSFQRQDQIELRIGPLRLQEYQSLLPGEPEFVRLRDALRYVLAPELTVDVRLSLRASEIPEPRVDGGLQLGRTFWLAGGRDNDAAEMRLCGVTSPKLKEAA